MKKLFIFCSLLPLFVVCSHAASFPSTPYVSSEIENEEIVNEVISTQEHQNLLGANTYNVTIDDGIHGTFFSTFSFHTNSSAIPSGWYTLANGSGLTIGDIINLTDLGESYTLQNSTYGGYLSPTGTGSTLGNTNYFLEANQVPLGSGGFILFSLCLAYAVFQIKAFKKKRIEETNTSTVL